MRIWKLEGSMSRSESDLAETNGDLRRLLISAIASFVTTWGGLIALAWAGASAYVSLSAYIQDLI